MAIWQNVTGLTDGQSVEAETFNVPIGQLVARTEYLKEALDWLQAQETHGAIIVKADLSHDDTPEVGDVVCIDPETKLYKKAIASMSLYDAYVASVKAFAIGVLVQKDGYSGHVALYGEIDTDGWDMSLRVDKGGFVSGQYYLSSVVPGKITRFPGGPRILVGFFSEQMQDNGTYTGYKAFINPQHMDIEAHAHRTYTLLARPCGDSRVVREQNDEDSAEYPGEVVVDGYLPVEVANGGVGIPRLVVCGDWTADYIEYYEITVSNGDSDCESPFTKWPVDVTWSKVGSGESGSGTLRFFGDSIPVGKLGMLVKLMPSDGMSEACPFGVRGLTDRQRTWQVNRYSGRGWSQSDAGTKVDFGGCVARFGGVSDRFVNHVSVVVPENIFDLTSVIDEIEENDIISIDDTEYKFTKDPDSDSDIQILDVTTDHSAFDTLAQLCGVVEQSVYCELGDFRQVLVGASSVVFRKYDSDTETYVDLQLDPVLLSGRTFAFVSYDNGQSLASPITVEDVDETLSVVPADRPWDVFELLNGLTFMLAETGALPSAGDEAAADIYCVPGAKYRYNIEFDNDLKLHFPPVPARSGCLMLNGVEMESYENYGDRAVIAIGDDSIYWRDGTEGRQPWPFPEMSQSDVVDPEDEYRELFHFVSEFHSETGPVTSLHPADGAPITIHRCGTDENATVGDLELDVDLTLGMSDQEVPGYKVPKASRGGKLLLGPVVEKLVAGPGISLSRTAGVPDGQGVVTISADGSEYAGDFETIALENAKLESMGMFPYVRMLKWDPDSDSNVPTGFVAKFHVPATASDGVYRVKFYATVFGEESFEGGVRNAGVRMDYNILPDFTSMRSDSVVETANLRTGIIRPDESFVVDIPFGVPDGGEVSYTAYDPILVHNDPSIEDLGGRSARVMDGPFPTNEECKAYIQNNRGLVAGVFGIRPGYTVAVRFSRANPSSGDPYTGAIGFLNLRWAIEEVATVEISGSEGGDDMDKVVRQTVRNLRKAAAKSIPMEKGYDLVAVLQSVINALR